MSHIYQPVMIRRILKGGGSASLEEIAAALMVYDRSQLEYYMIRTKNMVGRVLTNNGIVLPIKTGREIQAYRQRFYLRVDLAGLCVCGVRHRHVR